MAGNYHRRLVDMPSSGQAVSDPDYVVFLLVAEATAWSLPEPRTQAEPTEVCLGAAVGVCPGEPPTVTHSEKGQSIGPDSSSLTEEI